MRSIGADSVIDYEGKDFAANGVAYDLTKSGTAEMKAERVGFNPAVFRRGLS